MKFRYLVKDSTNKCCFLICFNLMKRRVKVFKLRHKKISKKIINTEKIPYCSFVLGHEYTKYLLKSYKEIEDIIVKNILSHFIGLSYLNTTSSNIEVIKLEEI